MELYRFLSMDRDLRYIQTVWKMRIVMKNMPKIRSALKEVQAAMKARDEHKIAAAISTFNACKWTKGLAWRLRGQTPAEQAYNNWIKPAETLKALILQEKRIDADIKGLIGGGHMDHRQLQMLQTEFNEIGYSSDWTGKCSAVVDLHQGLEEYDEDKLNQAIANCRKHGLDTNPHVQKETAAAKAVFERIAKEKAYIKTLREGLSKGALRRGDSGSVVYSGLEKCLPECKSFGMRTPAGITMVAVGDSIVSLRSALKKALGTSDANNWRDVKGAAEDMLSQHERETLEELGMKLECEADSALVFCELHERLMALLASHQETDVDAFNAALEECGPADMDNNGFPFVGDSRSCVGTIVQLAAALVQARAEVLTSKDSAAVESNLIAATGECRVLSQFRVNISTVKCR